MKFDWNDLAMAFLGAIFVVFGANLLSEVLYHSDVPETAGYEIEGGPLEVADVAEEEEVIVDASFMMANADPAAGQNVAKKCVACHNFGEGEAKQGRPVSLEHHRQADRGQTGLWLFHGAEGIRRRQGLVVHRNERISLPAEGPRARHVDGFQRHSRR